MKIKREFDKSGSKTHIFIEAEDSSISVVVDIFASSATKAKDIADVLHAAIKGHFKKAGDTNE